MMQQYGHETDVVNCTQKVWFNPFVFIGNGANSSGTRRADNVHGQFETGYYAFGARYYDCDLSGIFLSVDPMADKYPNILPYAYCAWNPIKLIDPNGEEISTHTDKEGNVVMVYNDGDNGVYRHNGDRKFTEKELKSKYDPSNTSAGGEYMGKCIIPQLKSFYLM